MSNKKPRQHLTLEEIDRLLSVIKSPRDAAIFQVAYHRGLRASEVGLLQLSDWQRDRGRLHVHRLKNSRSNVYVLTKAETVALKAWLRARGDDPGPLFTSRRTKTTMKGIDRRQLHVLMNKYGKLAGLPPDKRHPHALRHSCGMHLLNERRLDVVLVQDHLGHVDISNTLIYASVSEARRAEIGRALRDW